MESSTQWRNYEEVAAHLLNRFATDFGINLVEGKQTVPGQRSGTEYEIDAKGVRTSDGGIMIVECRRYTTSKLKQEDIAAVAYRIIDTQALGAIVVTPLGLQEGAEKIASAENIFSVKLDQNSTPTDFAMQFLNKFAIGASTTLFVKGEATYVLKNPDGTIEAEGKMQ